MEIVNLLFYCWPIVVVVLVIYAFVDDLKHPWDDGEE